MTACYRDEMQLDPISAVTAEDPYPYYERLAAERPFAYDEGSRCWVAAGVESVEAVLTDQALRVRPIAEPVPALMRDTALGTLFSQMVRMNEGPAHNQLQAVVRSLIDSLNTKCLDPHELGIDATPDALMFAYPSRAIAAMLGIRRSDVAGIEHHARALARAIGPGATATDIDHADIAVKGVDAIFAQRFDDAQVRSNAVAFLFQGYDGLAGAIGHALYPRSDRRELAIHNTRRFAAAEATIASTRVAAGDVVLAVLATAPRFAFGTGPHACVAAQIAPRIVDAAVSYARSHIALDHLVRRGFLPLQNVRIPRLEHERA
jgi:cytochrome P450